MIEVEQSAGGVDLKQHPGEAAAARRRKIHQVADAIRGVERASFQFVRHNDRNETVLCAMRDEGETLAKIGKRSAAFSTRLEVEGDEAVLRTT